MRDKYTFDQFNAATAGLRKIIEAIPGLERPKRGGDIWEVVTVCGFEGSEPVARAVFKAGADAVVSASIDLQDDGGDPYAVVALKRFERPSADWHAAAVRLEVSSIYPHQFDAIPYLVQWLGYSAPPVPPVLVLEDGGMQKMKAPLSEVFNGPAGERIRAVFQEGENARRLELETHPDNGKLGWWSVCGIRHSATAKASSAVEAVEKACKAGLVHDWEMATAHFIGETLPDVFA